MTAPAVEMRHARTRRREVPLPWTSRLAWRLTASHVAVAAIVVFLLSAPLDWGIPLTQIPGRGLAAIALGGVVGVAVARHVTLPIAALARVIESRGERELERGAVALHEQVDRSDEIGRLSVALRRFVSRFSDRIAANEDFAADVAHEIRNPLASLRAAAEALRSARDGQMYRLVDIIEEDVARLDRLVGEISSASRLDAALVREEGANFDLVVTVRRLTEHLSRGAASRGIEVIPDLPQGPILMAGLEARLAQVVVNVVENAISLCEEGDAIRVWMRRRDQDVLVVVEDTGPGIPEGAAEKIFRRFYSHRPAEKSAANSGLGLAISRQIVEAHGGVIWAENIRPTESDLLSEPLGARFAVALPL